MRHFQFTLHREAVYDHFAQLLLAHLRLQSYGRKCAADCLIRILAAAAAQCRSIHGTCAGLHSAPSDETVRQALAANLPELEELQRRLNRALAADLPKTLRRHRQRLAIDLVLIPYHGQPQDDPDELVRSQAKHGTTHFHGYATAYVLRKGRRFTLALTVVHRGEPLRDVVRRLLRQTAQVGVRPKLLLLDRGFFTVAVVRYLQTARIPFLMAMPIRGRKADHPKGAGGTRVLCLEKKSRWTRYTWKDPHGQRATVSVAVVYCPRRKRRPPSGRQRSQRRRGDLPFELYAYGGWQPRTLFGLRQSYRLRFGIESSYRQMNQARIRTSTRNPCVRLLYVGLALILRNVWVWLHYARLAGPRRGGRLFHWARLRLQALLAWLRQLTEQVFGVRDTVAAERPPPQGLQAA